MSQLGVTPTGNPPVQPAHIPWLTDAQYINYPTGTGITSSSTLYTTGTLTNMCAMACEYIENYCGRYFSSQTGIDEKYFDVNIGANRNVIVPLRNTPINNINSIYLQVLSFFIPISFEYLTVSELSGAITFVPLLNGSSNGSPLPAQVLNAGSANVWINYDFGYTTIPQTLVEVAVMLVSRYIGLQENPTGAETIRMGEMMISWKAMKGSPDPMTVMIQDMLKPYVTTYMLTT